MTGFVCQSFLKERRRSLTGGLREALEESLGKGFHALVPGVGSKMTLEPLLLDFPLPGENDGYCLEWNDPHWGGSCRSL